MNKRLRIQQVHAECGGQIVLVLSEEAGYELACTECNQLWGFQTPFALGVALCKDFKHCQ